VTVAVASLDGGGAAAHGAHLGELEHVDELRIINGIIDDAVVLLVEIVVHRIAAPFVTMLVELLEGDRPQHVIRRVVVRVDQTGENEAAGGHGRDTVRW